MRASSRTSTLISRQLFGSDATHHGTATGTRPRALGFDRFAEDRHALSSSVERWNRFTATEFAAQSLGNALISGKPSRRPVVVQTLVRRGNVAPLAPIETQ